MFCLVYRSVADSALKSQQISDLLRKARIFNKKNRITGCLLYYNREFLQYIEGNQIKVLRLYDKIGRDERHSKIQLLHSQEINEREFDTWDMAFENLDGNKSQLQYLKLLVSCFIDDAEDTLGLNPTSQKFWHTTKMMLKTKANKHY